MTLQQIQFARPVLSAEVTVESPCGPPYCFVSYAIDAQVRKTARCKQPLVSRRSICALAPAYPSHGRIGPRMSERVIATAVVGFAIAVVAG